MKQNGWVYLRVMCLAVASLLLASKVMADPALIPSAPQISAESYILMDAHSGKIIAEKNADEQLSPASLTKMMTSYIAEYEISKGNISLSDEVSVSEKAWRMGGSKMYIEVGKLVTIDDLLKGIIIQSGNDASVAIAEHISGGEDAFAEVMNHHATILGMTNSKFFNATGWPAKGHVSTARDLAILAKAIIFDFPEHYALYKEKYFTFNNIRQPNRNRLLWRDSSVDGLKTGHTDSAGYCLVSSAERDGMRLISVVMGTKSDEARAQESQKLLNYGFRYYQTYKIYQAKESLNESKVWYGTEEVVKLGIAEDLFVTIPRGNEYKKKLNATMDITPIIEAPININHNLGQLVLKLDEELIVQRPLIALNAVEESGFFARFIDAIKLFFFKLFM